ncbi:type I-F CRISPR-associated protein Csy1 [Testudinibacter aquarius]|uniref:CRISPR-associated Csy1 family protein n=1 Tax=Testudinibacter aquarius TaxID=1524974 RepID=A0A4R3Y7Z0_9PAST|nr:type I-F CRISPR-associated protein Csy1 [Testudinibacter aquarius]KAE9530177.1 hypothetical protein A1D24_06820 [Testudinibacter aquarius]TCV87960.1 CRISPR-associated Csy1 family protein [Testudinibacter aquarius]TNG90238.1 type I-F CRISPR-associated protein Csy1 [Testudinibacter aquarius]
MSEITSAQVKSAVLAFLTAQYEKKTESERKQLDKAQQADDLTKVNQLEATLATMRQKYSFVDWLEDAAERMAKQLKFGSHISKGVHPDAKGDNINFQTNRALPPGFLGSQHLNSPYLDANGNAAALPLAAFLDTEIAETGIKLRTLIMQDHSALDGVFADDKVRSARYQTLFKSALVNELSEQVTHERNKQLLFPLNHHDYRCLVPLYPSVLTHELYQKMIALRFSTENKTARENRFKKTVEQQPYVSVLNIAVTILGGTKPQNVSQLMSKQGGRNYLLPSLPPHFKQSYSLSIGDDSESLFAKSLAYLCRKPLKSLFKIGRTNYNNVAIRDARKACLDDILFRLIGAVSEIQQQKEAGWTREIKLNYHEKLWLDPKRIELDGEAVFKQDRATGDWRDKVAERFANWLNSMLKAEFKEISKHFSDAEHQEWRKEMNEMIQESLQYGQEVFQ